MISYKETTPMAYLDFFDRTLTTTIGTVNGRIYEEECHDSGCNKRPRPMENVL